MPEGWDDAKILQIWDRLADAWDRNRELIWSWTLPVSQGLIALLDPKPGDTILEVGAGTGDTGFLAASMLGDDCRLICTDFSREMLERARAVAEGLDLKNVEFRTMDVMSLDVTDGTLDGIIGRFVYHLVPDPIGAFREARRALKPGGRLCFAVFGDSIPFEVAIAKTMEILGLHMAPGITIEVELDTPRAITAALEAAGFSDTLVEEAPFVVRFPDAAAAWRYLTDVFGRTADLVAGLSEEMREAFRETFLAQLEPFVGEAGYEIPNVCLNARATKS
jgi:ubiquinone/menaquinone biosynthesis C-methylase UbiE